MAPTNENRGYAELRGQPGREARRGQWGRFGGWRLVLGIASRALARVGAPPDLLFGEHGVVYVSVVGSAQGPFHLGRKH